MTAQRTAAPALTVKKASVEGRCACCMMPYREGARLVLEHERFWVLDPHPMPRPDAHKRGGRA